MRKFAFLMTATTLVCGGCGQMPPYGTATVNPPACETVTVPVEVGGRPEQATVEACPQPDGSWRITQTTPGLPPQVYVMPPPPAGAYSSAYADYGDYFDYWPFWAGGPWFWGIAPTVVVVQHFHHFHHFALGGPAGRPLSHGFAPDAGHAVAAPPGGAIGSGGHR